MNLLIISHTEHYKNSSGEITGWGPTIREINYLADYFDKIYHCAPLLQDNIIPPSSLKYESNNIEYVPLIPTGGSGIKAKINILYQAPKNIATINKIIDKVDYFQFRAPTGMGVYLIPWLILKGRKGWFKYAGNWAQENPPIGYAFQRWLLKSQSKYKVTINGNWPNQASHCLTFENPCLSDDELIEGKVVLNNKNYSEKLNFCFVGRLESAKGVGRILEAFSKLEDKSRVGTIHLVGDGDERAEFEYIAKKIPLDIKFHGFVSRDNVAQLLKKSHIFLLPSTASEGFPKVIAEAANYGCLPIVSDVSSIGQYIKNNENGFLVNHKDNTGEEFQHVLAALFNSYRIEELVSKAQGVAIRFTFSHYLKSIETKIMK